MHFPYALKVILICLIVACNGQFKVIGLLDTKSENNNGKVESIRSFDEVLEPFPRPQTKDVSEADDLTEAINVSESSDINKENVNFIKPYELVTNEFKIDSVEATSESNSIENNTGNVLDLDETDQKDAMFEKSVNSEIISDSDVEATSTLSTTTSSTTTSSTTTSSTTIGAKAYRKTFLPNIRKFSYIEARSFHHPDSSNKETANSRWNNYKFIKVLKYRNKYKSKCRCERIWNCPKIQISIQRCEPDYFMCCF